MAAEAECVTVFNFDRFFGFDAKLSHQFEGFFVADDYRIGVSYQYLAYRRRVIGLNVLDKQVIERASAQRGFDVFEKLPQNRPVYRVKKHGFIVHKEVTVIRYARGDRVEVFKQAEPVIVRAYPE